MIWTSLLLAGLAATPAADLSTSARTLRKEPAYAGVPRYCQLAFGPEARHRVWLVQDGDTLYVDRNGSGDLTEPGKRVAARPDDHAKENGYTFEAGDLAVGGKVHKGLTVSLVPLKRYADNPALGETAAIRDAFRADPAAVAATVTVDVESTRFQGVGVGGRLWQQAGFYDLTGVLTFGNPADAPVVHFDGPLTVTFYGELPTLSIGRNTDLVLTVGTPGRGPGTFAMLGYQDTIPAGLRPTVAVRWPGDPPEKELFELKERC